MSFWVAPRISRNFSGCSGQFFAQQTRDDASDEWSDTYKNFPGKSFAASRGLSLGRIQVDQRELEKHGSRLNSWRTIGKDLRIHAVFRRHGRSSDDIGSALSGVDFGRWFTCTFELIPRTGLNSRNYEANT
jgi:hypothetical protein